jgi:FkbM family methyltransferase
VTTWERARKTVNRRLHGPRLDIHFDGELLRLGSQYGGWVFCPTALPRNGVVVSCGLGEDASFDVEVAAAFDARVIIVDPTPRSIIHFHGVVERIGEGRMRSYTTDGQQPLESYNLSTIRREQLTLIEKALTDHVGVARFYAPPNVNDVSHSVVNFQNDYSDSTPFIEVPCTDFGSLVEEAGAGEPDLVKFDIEGAEIVAIPSLLDLGLRPKQVLVEYDELSRPSAQSRRKFERVHSKLLECGYRPIFFDGRTCLSYLREASP